MAENDFGLSFDHFKAQDGVDTNKDDSFCNGFAEVGKGVLDVTFESDLFEFSVADSSVHEDKNDEAKSSWFPDFSILQEDQAPQQQQAKVHVAIHEQLSAIYDDFSQEGSISVTGSILVKSATMTSFDLTVNDEVKYIQRIEPFETVCKLGRYSTKDRELLIKLNSLRPNEEFLVANYFCTPKLRPVPLVR
jgi:hypothetical protein